ncbi:MAG: hypothetical protein R2749_00045 [Acidimicrobiales bacterium]
MGSTSAASATDRRNHSSWVLAQNGGATSCPSQEAVCSGASSTLSVKAATSAASVMGRR